ncbi:MAG: NAD+ synthase [Phycisphaerales bacterium]|nr:MAG: NAD+ synthase [Phycisphaerales bacterium]
MHRSPTMGRMRIALAQLNPTVGDIPGNTRLILEAIDRAREEAADLLITPELAVLGYPPRDLLLREGIIQACEEAVEQIARAVHEAGGAGGGPTVIVGHPRQTRHGRRGVRNSASVCHGGQVVAVHDKRLLPGYDVFDEDRYFDPGTETTVVEVAGRRLGILICEDLWRAADVDLRSTYEFDPVAEAVEAGAEALIALNASPFVRGKFARHVRYTSELAQRTQRPIVMVNQTGANDDLVFDGRSMIVHADGTLRAMLPAFEACTRTVELAGEAIVPVDELLGADSESLDSTWNALVIGTRDYIRKTGHTRAIIGLSGGIDSALVAAITAQAIGADNLIGVRMPSRFSSPGSLSDAQETIERLGIGEAHEIPIREAHKLMQSILDPALGDVTGTLADENVQARLRGVILMTISNATGGLVMSTSNKSEMAVGYSTLYGDMCGAVAPIADLLKVDVYALSRWVNDHHDTLGFVQPPIPENSITKPPSAELRANQTDQDSLPEYEVLDQIVERFVERDQSVERIIEETGIDATVVEKFTRMIDFAQYKRDQAVVIPKVSPRAFGRGRVMPIVMKPLPVRISQQA